MDPSEAPSLYLIPQLPDRIWLFSRAALIISCEVIGELLKIRMIGKYLRVGEPRT